QVAGMMLEEIQKELRTREVEVDFTPEVAGWVVQQAPKTGSARALRSVIRDRIEDPLSMALLKKPRGRLRVGVRDGALSFEELEEVSLV
ncbi:MAG: Clp protease, partial [Thermus sp.]